MTEQLLAERMRAAVAQEPPLGFDPDDVVDRAALRQRRRVAVMSVSAGTVALAVATVAIAGLPTGSGGAPAPAAVQPPVAETSVTETSLAPSPLGDVDELTSKLERLAPQVIGEHAPALKDMLREPHSWKTVGGQKTVGVVALYGPPGPAVSVGAMHMSTWEAQLEGGLPLVSDTTNPDGTHTRVYRSEEPDGERGLVVLREQANGVVISVGAADALGIPQDALVAIANDSRLRF